MSYPACPTSWALGTAATLLASLACAPTPAPTPQAPPTALETRPAVPAAAPAGVPGTSRDVYYLDPASIGYELPKERDGTIRFPSNDGPPNLDPFGENLRAHPYVDTAYDQLVAKRLAPGQKLLAAETICRLCESWELASDQKTYTFKLRQNVKWHDGTEFTADDVVFTVEKSVDPKTAFRYRGYLTPVQKVEPVDRHTVRIVTKAPDVEFLPGLANPIWMIPKHAYEKGVDMTRTVIGTGPFKLARWDRDVELVVERNDTFWLEGRPWAKRIESKFIPDKSTRTAAFLTKQVDAVSVVDFREFEPLQKQAPDIQWENYGGQLVNSLLLNHNRKPLGDKRVRKAMHLAIDRDEMSKVLTNGLGAKYLAPATPADWQSLSLTQEELAKMPGYRQPKDQDIAEAKRLLAEAGYPEGFRIASMTSRANTSTPLWQEVAAAQLAKIGVIVEQELPEAGVANDRRGKGDFDIHLDVAAGSTSIPSRNYGRYTTGYGENFTGYSHPEYEKLVEELNRTFEEKKRWEIIKKIQLFLLEELPTVPLVETASFAAWHPYLHNWRNYRSAWTHPWAPSTELLWSERK